MIRYTCGNCGVGLETDNSLAGKTESCPMCGHVQVVLTGKKTTVIVEQIVQFDRSFDASFERLKSGAIPGRISWPMRCACCGQAADTTLKLEYSVSHSSGDRQVTETTSIHAPYCRDCREHCEMRAKGKESFTNGLVSFVMGVPLFAVLFLALLGDGHRGGAWTCAFLTAGCLALGILSVVRGVRAMRKARARMSGLCCSIVPAIQYCTDVIDEFGVLAEMGSLSETTMTMLAQRDPEATSARFSRFEFRNPAYAQDFARLNEEGEGRVVVVKSR